MEFKLPPLPTTLGDILQVLSHEVPEPDDRRLVEIIRKDPAISIYVLRHVNSAYYGLQRHVTEIHRAVALLGLQRVCNLVLAAALKQTFAYLEDKASRTVYEHVIKTSVATAAFARDLVTHLHLPLNEMAFTAGLLHQLGRLVFLYSAPHRYVPLWFDQMPTINNLPLEAPSPETEHACFDTDYLQLGAATLREWGLPEEFVTITKHLHTPEQMSEGPLRSLTLAVAVGSAASDALFSSETKPNGTVRPLPPPLAALAEAHDARAEDLLRLLDERNEPTRVFAQSVVSDS